MKNTFVLIFPVLFILTACGNKPADTGKIQIKSTADSTQTATDTVITNDKLIQQAKTILQLFSEKDYSQLASLCAPEGVRFSPYSYIDAKNDIVLKPGQFKEAAKSNQKFLWGQFDGSGEPISMTMKEYFARFVTDADFLKDAVITVDECLGGGNTYNNIREVYNGLHFVNFYLSGTKENANMDWKALRFVFRADKGKLLLIGVVHDEWTV